MDLAIEALSTLSSYMKQFLQFRIQNKENLGRSKGNDEGIKVAKGDIIVLLSNDMEVDPNWLSEMEYQGKGFATLFVKATKMRDAQQVEAATIGVNRREITIGR